MTPITWQQVALDLIDKLPTILTGIGVIVIAVIGWLTKRKVDQVPPQLADVAAQVGNVEIKVDGRFIRQEEMMKEVSNKLEVALREIGELKGEPPATIAQAATSNVPTLGKESE